MNPSTVASFVYESLWVTIILVGPPLLLGTVVAFLIGLMQAVTQTHEQTLPQTVKIVLITLVLVVLGHILVAPLYTFSLDLFTQFPNYVR